VNQFPKKKDVSLEAALHISMLISWQNISMLITPSKINIEPENELLEEEIPIKNHPF